MTELIKAVKELLGCCELNMDDMEPNTLECINKVIDILENMDHDRTINKCTGTE